MLSWYVVQSKPQKEEWLYNQLSTLQIEAYYPCLREKNGKSDARKPKPYFPGYLFVNVDLELIGISVLQWLPGSLGLVSFGGDPACLPDALLQKIRYHVDQINNSRDEVLESLRPGDEIVINSGPFAGRDAIFCDRLRGNERVQVLLEILQGRAIRINLSVEQLTVTKQSRTLL